MNETAERSTIDVQTLARELAARMAPDALLDSEDVAAMLKVSVRYFREEYAPAPGFPRPVRLKGVEDRRSTMRWQRADIVAWVEAHKERRNRSGRRRNPTDL